MLSETQSLERLRPSHIQSEEQDVAVLEEYKGELGICVKVEKELQGIFLDDSRFSVPPISESMGGSH